jgi:hypothetical protein
MSFFIFIFLSSLGQRKNWKFQRFTITGRRCLNQQILINVIFMNNMRQQQNIFYSFLWYIDTEMHLQFSLQHLQCLLQFFLSKICKLLITAVSCRIIKKNCFLVNSFYQAFKTCYLGKFYKKMLWNETLSYSVPSFLFSLKKFCQFFTYKLNNERIFLI